MRQGFLILGTVTSLLMSAGAAASDVMREDGVAPGVYFRMSFGGTPQAAPARPFLPDSSAALDSTATEANEVSTTTWVVLGVVVAAVVIAVAQNKGSGGSGSGGSRPGY